MGVLQKASQNNYLGWDLMNYRHSGSNSDLFGYHFLIRAPEITAYDFPDLNPREDTKEFLYSGIKFEATFVSHPGNRRYSEYVVIKTDAQFDDYQKKEISDLVKVEFGNKLIIFWFFTTNPFLMKIFSKCF